MVITENLEVNSIVNYFKEINPVKVYFEKIAGSVTTPSMYFAIPKVESNVDSFSSYINKYQLFVEINDTSSSKAYDTGENIVENIKSKRYMIPVYEEDGTKTNKYIRIDKAALKETENGIVQIELIWKSRHPFGSSTSSNGKMKELDINIILEKHS